jgi:oxygen-independent coproporphyrinogen-3 oxidase
MKKLGIYVQVPFCQTKCTYCNFHTGVVASARFAPYVEAVCQEIRGHGEFLRAAGLDWESGPTLKALGVNEWRVASGEPEFAVDTVYFGGGTPSLLEPGHLQNVLEAIRDSFRVDLTEVTLEADPETITPEKAAAWVRAFKISASI